MWNLLPWAIAAFAFAEVGKLKKELAQFQPVAGAAQAAPVMTAATKTPAAPKGTPGAIDTTKIFAVKRIAKPLP